MINNFQLKIRLILLFLLFVWMLGIFSPGIFNLEKIPKGYLFINLCYSQTCHQNPAKTILFNGAHILVCSRCLGIYAGLLFSGILSLFRMYKNFRIKYFLLSGIPMILDIIFYDYIGLYGYSKTIAFLTGFLLGSLGFFLILQGIEITLTEIFQKGKT